MNKEEVVSMMFESFNNDNLQMALQSGMPEQEVRERFENSKPAIEFMLSNVYDLLVTKDIIKNN